MAKHIGVKIPDDLLAALKGEKVVAVLATFSEKGLPHTTPVQYLYPKGSESILFSIYNEHVGYHNLVWQKKVMLCFMDEGNMAYSILGRCGVVLAPSQKHPQMNIVRMDIIDIKSDQWILTKIESGIKWSHTSPEAEELSKALFSELKELAVSL